MITSLRLVDFKNFADETLRVGPFTVIVGANASGKSNIRDAFRFLHGIGRGYTLAEIIGGKYGPGGQIEWEPIRGANNEIVRLGYTRFSIEVRIQIAIDVKPRMGSPDEESEDRSHGPLKDVTYFICIFYDGERRDFSIMGENLRIDSESLYTNNIFEDMNLDRRQPALNQLAYSLKGYKYWIHVKAIENVLAEMRFLDLVPDRMRQPAFPGNTVLGDGGENLPAVLKEICGDEKRKKILTEWVSELTPMDVADLAFPDDPSGRVHLSICERNGRKLSAYSASDGTLRFLSILAALLGKNTTGLYFFEEIDTGIHPARLWLLLSLIERQTVQGGTQVITTSHSPDMLTFADDTTFENISVVSRLEDSHDAIIRRLADLPNARKLRATQGLGRLLSRGWMEDALAFTEGNKGNDGDPE